MIDYVILAAGDYPSHPYPLHLLREAAHVVCCDSAAVRYIETTGQLPEAVVGDGDSLPEAYKVQLGTRWHRVAEQDYNDLTKATRYLLANGVGEGSTVAYLGATGRREDHTLGNISLLAFYRREFGLRPIMATDHGLFTAHCGDTSLRVTPGQQVSLFNLSAGVMSSRGLRWPVSAYREWWRGTLNEATAETVDIQADGEYIVFREYTRI